jgi:hypothetical protein
MAEKSTDKKQVVSAPAPSLFGKENYIWIVGGLIVMLLGLVLMAGGDSKDPNVFHKDEVYSVRRITIAPIVILIGLAIEVFAIFRKPKP